MSHGGGVKKGAEPEGEESVATSSGSSHFALADGSAPGGGGAPTGSSSTSGRVGRVGVVVVGIVVVVVVLHHLVAVLFSIVTI